MAIYILAVHKKEVQRSFKNRQCHVNNISINLEHNHEQDEKVERQPLRARVKWKATDDITSRPPISLWDRWMFVLSPSSCIVKAGRSIQFYQDPEITIMCTLAVYTCESN